MDNPFSYDKYVTGKHFLGRKSECTALANLLSEGEHVTIYEPPKSGKMSLIQQTLVNLRLRNTRFIAGQFTMMNVRTVSGFVKRYGATAIRLTASAPSEFESIIGKHLSEKGFRFDSGNFSECGDLLSFDGSLDDEAILAVLRLPWEIAAECGKRIIIIINEFQNIDYTEDGERLFKLMEKVIDEMKGTKAVSLVMCGSQVNAMKSIFEWRHFFHKRTEHLPLAPVDEKEIIEHVVRGFLSSGKVIERELLLGVCRLFRNNLWYINHFISICDSLSKGYIVETTLMEALGILISIHEPRMIATMDSLTSYQISLLRAILDGNVKFSAAEVIQQYVLNSSANVKRLKDALMKKEIVTFGENDEPVLLDPLFEYWVRKYYFEIYD